MLRMFNTVAEIQQNRVITNILILILLQSRHLKTFLYLKNVFPNVSFPKKIPLGTRQIFLGTRLVRSALSWLGGMFLKEDSAE